MPKRDIRLQRSADLSDTLAKHPARAHPDSVTDRETNELRRFSVGRGWRCTYAS